MSSQQIFLLTIQYEQDVLLEAFVSGLNSEWVEHAAVTFLRIIYHGRLSGKQDSLLIFLSLKLAYFHHNTSMARVYAHITMHDFDFLQSLSNKDIAPAEEPIAIIDVRISFIFETVVGCFVSFTFLPCSFIFPFTKIYKGPFFINYNIL